MTITNGAKKQSMADSKTGERQVSTTRYMLKVFFVLHPIFLKLSSLLFINNLYT